MIFYSLHALNYNPDSGVSLRNKVIGIAMPNVIMNDCTFRLIYPNRSLNIKKRIVTDALLYMTFIY
ncbi:MAG: hypothetical protein WBW94_08425 [Anaerolineales bacterium]